MKRLIVGLILLVGMPFLLSYTAVPIDALDELPEGFVLTVVQSGLGRPLDTEALPDGSLLVAEKGRGSGTDGRAYIHWIRDGVRTIIADLSINAQQDSGILGIIPDPDFAVNQQFYVWYASGVDAPGYDGESSVRLSRFTLNMEIEYAENEQLIFDSGLWAVWHMGGGLAFDDEGNLYIGIGDVGNHTKGQDLSSLRSKILRIRPTDNGYTIPSDNPFINTPNARPEIYAIGVRNPFRMTQHSDGRIIIGDVGLADWEEVNVLVAGANYGWGDREGVCPIGQAEPCAAAGDQFTDPAIVYPHELREANGEITNVGAITALAFYEGSGYPANYHDTLFLSDSVLSWIQIGDLDTGELTPFSDTTGIVDATYSNDRILLTQYHTGIIYALEHTGQLNSFPSVSLDVSETLGEPPLEVVFEATPFDADGEEMTLLWDFGDGSSPRFAGTIVTHTYTADGAYDPSITATDESGGATTTTERVIVYSGEMPQIQVDNLTESGRERYRGGDGVRMTAVRSTTDDLAENPYTWDIDLHHNIHKHSLFSGIDSNDYGFFIPTENHDGDWSLWYEFRLTMHTADGIDITISKEVFPQYVDLIFESNVPATLTVNRIEKSAPHTFRSIVGIENQIVAPLNYVDMTGFYSFAGWDTDEGTVLDVLAPYAAETWTATYTFDKRAFGVFVPFIETQSLDAEK